MLTTVNIIRTALSCPILYGPFNVQRLAENIQYFFIHKILYCYNGYVIAMSTKDNWMFNIGTLPKPT